VAYQYADRLTRAGHKVTVFTPDYGGKEVRSSKFEVRSLPPLFKYGKAAFVPQLALGLSKFDIVHLHYPFYGGAEVVATYDQFRSLPLVTTYHMDVIGEGLVAKVAAVHRKALLPWVIKRSKKILVSSLDYARNSQLQPFYSQIKDRIVEMPFAVDTERFQSGKNDFFRKKYTIPNDVPLILFVGGLDPEHYFKGLHVLFNALKKLESEKWYLTIVGNGSLKQEYEAKVRDLGLADRVCFTCGIDNNELAEFYRNSDFFVFPSIDRSEAFGLVALEAQASGIPVVASDLDGVRTVVNDRRTGLLVEPNNSTDLAEKIKLMLKNSDVRDQFAKNARRHVEEKYSWEVILPKLINVYNEVKK